MSANNFTVRLHSADNKEIIELERSDAPPIVEWDGKKYKLTAIKKATGKATYVEVVEQGETN